MFGFNLANSNIHTIYSRKQVWNVLWSKWNNLEIWGKSFTILFYSKFTSWFFFVFLFLAFMIRVFVLTLEEKKILRFNTNKQQVSFFFILFIKQDTQYKITRDYYYYYYVCRLKIHLYLCVWQVGIYPFKKIIQLFMFFFVYYLYSYP